MNVIGKMLDELYRIFNIVNQEKFESLLPMPVITIQKTKGNNFGHFITNRIWRDKNNVVDDNIEVDDNDTSAQYEININPTYFYERDAINIVETLIHEMCHYWNKIKDIDDGNHNKKFKAIAEKVGLECERGKNVGYGYTALSPTLKSWIENVCKPDNEIFKYYSANKTKPTVTRERKTFKYTCPVCGLVVKGKRDIEVKCVECDELMEIEDED
jgi:predicted SprT family Zn-dependent metalloprotease